MSDRNKEVAQRFLEEPWTNVDAVDELVSSDFVGHDPTSPEPIRGPQGAKEFIRTFLTGYPDGRITCDDVIAEGDRVAVRWTGRGTHQGELMGIAPTGRQVTVSGQSFFRLQDGKIVEEYVSWDTLGMLVQLGVAPQPAQA